MHPALPLLASFMLFSPGQVAQEKATTDSGKRVILFKDGTWKPDILVESMNTPGEFKRPKQSTSKVVFNKSKFVVYYNPELWKKYNQDQPTRQMYQHKDGDGYAIVIAERMQVTLESLKNVALSNAKSAAPDARIVLEESRVVNGINVLVLQIKGTIQGMAVTYMGYYYAGSEGCIQVLTYTTDNLFSEFKNDFQDILNGLSIES
jgi:hypothetical protein